VSHPTRLYSAFYNLMLCISLQCQKIYFNSGDSSVGIAATRSPKFDSQQGQEIFLSSTAARLDLGPTQPPIQWIPGTLSPGVKQQRREADHSSPSSAEVKKGGAIPPLPHVS
jgi:hypothetical protein